MSSTTITDSMDCYRLGYAIDGTSVPYSEFSCLYPQLEPFYSEFEKNYDPSRFAQWMRYHSMVPVYAVVLYGILIAGGQYAMKNRLPWNWRGLMALWNLSLSVFSWIGMFRTLPSLLHNFYYMSIRDNFCIDPTASYGTGSTGFWVQLFILSKFPELIDTFFIVIHKKPLIFLHWYHHITVLLYCWHGYVTVSPTGIIFCTMNYAVHASMYGYYFLMAVKMRPKWFNPIIITIFQISQMVVGVAVTLLGFYYYKTDPECAIQKENNIAAFFMYGSYLFLFLQFFFGRYFKKGKKQKSV